MASNFVISQIEMRTINKNGLLANFWVTLQSGISFKCSLIQTKDKTRSFLSLPTESYTQNNERKYRKLISLNDENYKSLQEAIMNHYENNKGDSSTPQAATAPRMPEQVPDARPATAPEVPEMSGILDDIDDI